MKLIEKTSPQGVVIEYIEPEGLTTNYEVKAMPESERRKVSVSWHYGKRNPPATNTGD